MDLSLTLAKCSTVAISQLLLPLAHILTLPGQVPVVSCLHFLGIGVSWEGQMKPCWDPHDPLTAWLPALNRKLVYMGLGSQSTALFIWYLSQNPPPSAV